MAYWLLCQSCKEWNKFPTALSDEKTCSFCGTFFAQIKPANLGSISSEDKKAEQRNPQPRISEAQDAAEKIIPAPDNEEKPEILDAINTDEPPVFLSENQEVSEPAALPDDDAQNNTAAADAIAPESENENMTAQLSPAPAEIEEEPALEAIPADHQRAESPAVDSVKELAETSEILPGAGQMIEDAEFEGPEPVERESQGPAEGIDPSETDARGTGIFPRSATLTRKHESYIEMKRRTKNLRK